MKCIVWDYRYNDMRETWSKPLKWIVNSLNKQGIEVKRKKEFSCNGLESLPIYNSEKDNPSDICIYNHTDDSHIIGNVLQTKVNWFYKETSPEPNYFTLDEIGYGAYSSITYNKPNFEKVDLDKANDFFNTKVVKWIDNKTTKWGKYFQSKTEKIPYNDYYLIIGQCSGDEVVNRFDFGDYVSKLEIITRELIRIDRRTIIIKLHPYMDGKDAVDTKYSETIKNNLERISPDVKVYIGKYNIHSFIENARAVLLANSGSGFEVMMHDKPIISWGLPEYHWISYNLFHLTRLHKAIKIEDWFDKEASRKFLYWYMENHVIYNQETSDRRISELLHNRGLK